MKLAEKSSGILETYVTWRDIEEEMQKALGTTATFGEKKSARNIGEGNGFMSRMALIEPDWIDRNSEAHDLPKTFIVKICSQLTLVEFCDKMEDENSIFDQNLIDLLGKHAKKLHNVEVDMYHTLHKYAGGKVPLPKLYGAKKFLEPECTKAYIIMEHMTELVSVHVVDDIGVDAVRQVLRAVAVMEAVGLKLSDEQKSSIPNNILTEFFGPIFTPEMMNSSLESCRKLNDPVLSKRIPVLETIVLEIADMDSFVRLEESPRTLGMTPVLCHGDLWSTNMLWGGCRAQLKLLAVIDFQTAHMGNPAADLCRLICATMGGDERRENYEQLLEDFYGYLREEVEGEMPYTLEQLKESYEMFFPFAALAVFPSIFPLLEYLKKHRDEERRPDIEENCMSKAMALIDDCISGHSKNQQKYANL